MQSNILIKEDLGYFGIYVNALKLIWLGKVLTSDHEWKSIIKASYPKDLLLEQLGSSLPTEEDNLNTFGIHVFQAYA